MEKSKLTLIKIGGNIVDNPSALHAFLRDFSALPGLKILVHGGGKMATQLAARLDIKVTMVEGRRVTDEESLKVVTMVYAGLANKDIIAQLQSFQCNALGLSGADANLIRARKRPVQEVDYGFAGDLSADSINSKQLQTFLAQGLVPVFSAITHNGEGQLLNTNADTVAAELAIALSGYYDTDLIYCFEKRGVLSDVNDENSVIPAIDRTGYQHYKEDGVIAAGMVPKLDNAFSAVDRGVKHVIIKHAEEILSEQNGTIIS